MTPARRAQQALFTAGALVVVLTQAASPQSDIVGWGQRVVDSRLNDEVFVEIATSRTGYSFTVLRRSNGTLAAYGDNSSGQCIAPTLPPGLSYVQVEANGEHTLALRSDGVAVDWGNTWGTPPSPPA